jgi:hypothetical protein
VERNLAHLVNRKILDTGRRGRLTDFPEVLHTATSSADRRRRHLLRRIDLRARCGLVRPPSGGPLSWLGTTAVPERRPRQAADDGIGLTEAALGEDGGDVTGIRRDRVEAGEASGQQGGETLIDVEGDMPPPPVESL